VNKAQIVARVARESGLTKAAVLRALDGFLDVVGRTLHRGERVTLVGFGTFHVGRHRARAAHNPRTGLPMRVPARKRPKFTPGKDLLKLVR
jgi:DNA-binding protein HU-beta